MDYIQDLLSRNEGKTLEFKRDLSSPDGFLKTVIAFANTSGGKVVIGVEDKTKVIRGVPDPLRLEEQIANYIAHKVSPIVLVNTEVLSSRKKQMLVVEIYPSSHRPHHFKALGEEQGTFVRVGSTNRAADKAMIQELRRRVSNLSFDEEQMPELNSEAIDFRVASELFGKKRALKESNLETLGLIAKHQGRKVPTVGGMILFGLERERYFPDAWIQAGRFEGITKRKISDSLNIRSYPPTAVEEAIAFVSKYSKRAIEIGRVKNKIRWSMPPLAIREAIINAVVHADYSQRGAPTRVAIFDDRVEIENPGILPFGLAMEDVRRGVSSVRNHVIGRVFVELGLVEHWGSGVQRIIDECKEYGLREPLFEEIGMRFRVTFFTSEQTPPRIADIDQVIVSVLGEKGDLSTAELAKSIKRSPRTTRTRLKALSEKGIVKEMSQGLNDPKKQYRLARRDFSR